ncbi:MAG: hypothetical protein AAB601_02940, partial [Patescibacteria group bacterium]
QGIVVYLNRAPNPANSMLLTLRGHEAANTDGVLRARYLRCTGSGGAEPSLIIPLGAEWCGPGPGLRGTVLSWDSLEDGWIAAAPEPVENLTPADYVTVAAYDLSVAGMGTQDLELVALDRTEIRFADGIPPTAPPGVPPDLSLSLSSSGEALTVAWGNARDPDTVDALLEYDLHMDGGAWTAATSGVLIAAEPETTYTVEVRARDGEGNTSESSVVSTTTLPRALVEETLFEISTPNTDSPFWGRGSVTAVDQIAQKYVPQERQRACSVGHQVARFENPTDEVVLRLWEGGPTPGAGTLLGTVSVSGASLPGGTGAYAEFRLPACVPLESGIAYWFEWSRTAPNPNNGYISRYRNWGEYPFTSYWQLNPFTFSPVGWAEYNREWSFRLTGIREPI